MVRLWRFQGLRERAMLYVAVLALVVFIAACFASYSFGVYRGYYEGTVDQYNLDCRRGFKD